ncbi:MAG: MFS transporter [Candidatus Lokiarchaeota archaeon]
METSELKPNNFNENVILKQNCKQYLFFLFGQTLSILGSSTVSFIIVLWITYETGSVILLTLSSFFYLIPQIGVTLIAGVISDRFNKKKMIFISDFSQAMVTLLLFLFFSFGSKFIWIILIISALRSVFQSIQIPIVKALIPIMVPQEHLSRMNSLNFFMNSFILLISPLIATLLLSVLSVNKVILLDIITFFIAVIPLVIITIPEVKNKNVKSKKSFFSDLKEGFNLISEIKGFKSLIILAMCNIFIYYPFQVLLPIFISKIHHGDESNLALVISFLNCGILLGAFISFIKSTWAIPFYWSFVIDW